MTYIVKEIYYTLQGEGANTGRPAVFLRFSGCNLWSGREVDRKLATCTFCDTDFVGVDGPGGGRFTTPDELAEAVVAAWSAKKGADSRFVVCTGGEPLLQLDSVLVEALQREGFTVAVETNGTIPAPSGVDWICVSPKAQSHLVQRHGNELKLVFPQPNVEPAAYADLHFDHYFLQPMDGPDRQANVALAVEYCLQHPAWRLSLQTHKLLGIR